MIKPKPNHGGKRPGAGRKPKPDKRVPINARVKPETKAEMDRQAGTEGLGKLLDRKFAKRGKKDL